MEPAGQRDQVHTAGRTHRGRGSRANGHAEILVSDNGRGIPPSSCLTSSSASGRPRQQRRAQGGIGLGLAIVRQLVESHGGTVRAESEGLDRGATFVVCLPHDASIMPSVSTESEGRRRAQRRRGLWTPTRRCRGSRCWSSTTSATRASSPRRTAPAEADVDEADSAEAALRALERGTPDVILCDIAMPIATDRSDRRDPPTAAAPARRPDGGADRLCEMRGPVPRARGRVPSRTSPSPSTPPTLRRWSRSWRERQSPRHAAATDEVDDDADDGERHQNVNRRTGDVEHAKPEFQARPSRMANASGIEDLQG